MKKYFDLQKGDLPKALLLFASFFLIILVFATIRPLQNSLVVSKLGTKAYPYIWTISGLFIGLVVLVFGKLADILSRQKIFALSVGSTIVVFTVLRFYLESNDERTVKIACAILAIWSDVFVVVMIEQFWAFANDFFRTKGAKRLYGLIDTGSVLGGVIGSLSVSLLVKTVGSMNILFFCIFYLILLLIPALLVGKFESKMKGRETFSKKEYVGAWTGFRLIWNKKYLRYIMLAVLLTQVVTNLVEYQFSAHVEQMKQAFDTQTKYLGNFHFYINFSSFLFNGLLLGPLLTYAGVRSTMLILPVTSIALSGAQLLFSAPNVSLVNRVLDKSMGYSFFRGAKEILYIPLESAEKFKAKTVIDMFVYRFGKFLGSLLIVPAVQFLGLGVLNTMIVVLGMVNVLIVVKVTSLYQRVRVE